MKKIILSTLFIFTIFGIVKAQNSPYISPYTPLCGNYEFDGDIYLPMRKALRLASKDEWSGTRMRLSVGDGGGVFDYYPTLYFRAGKANENDFNWVMTLRANSVDINGDLKSNTLTTDVISGNSSNKKVKIQTNYGYVELGPTTASYSAINTDLPYFYFNKPVRVSGGQIGSNSGNLLLQTAGTTRMTVTTTGNVGIANTSPAYKLDVSGTARITSDFRLGGTQYIPYEHSLIFGHETDKTKRLRIYYAQGSSSASSGDAYIQSGGMIYFYSGASTNPIAYFDKNGNFNVGWDGAPTDKKNLRVNGKLMANTIEVKTNVWADFVFADNYDLPSLSEVKSHIEAHKHLPDIPSEAEVMEKGIDVGEMQAKLLQKIEELTLYAIQQQDMIEKQQDRIEQQQNMVEKQHVMIEKQQNLMNYMQEKIEKLENQSK